MKKNIMCKKIASRITKIYKYDQNIRIQIERATSNVCLMTVSIEDMNNIEQTVHLAVEGNHGNNN